MARIFRFVCCVVFALLPAASAQTTSAKLVVRNARLFTMADAQQTPFLGYLAVASDGTILAAAPGEPPASLHAARTVDAHGDWMIPGFISAHSHLWQAAYRGLAEDKTLSGWLDDLYGKRAGKAPPEDFYWFCLQGSLDHLQHGVTAAYNFTYSDPARSQIGFDQAQFRAEKESGIRFVHGYQPDRIQPDGGFEAPRARLQSFLAWTRSQGDTPGFLSVMLNGSTSFNTTYQQAVMEAALMKEFHLGNQSHYLEPPETVDSERAKFPWFVNSGLLSNQMIFGHFVHPDDAILQQTAKAGASMSWNPLSNGRLASGVPDIPRYLKLGIPVGMGVDGEASADLADPFENMRAGLYAIRDKYQDAGVLSAYQVLWLHTMGSARVLKVADKLGSLQKGKYADFLLIHPTRLGAVLEDPYANLVFAASERDLDAVYVGGELQVDHGTLTHHDLNKVEAEVSRRVLAAH